MNQIRLFCAECGRTDSKLHENFCQDCFWKFNSLADPKQLEVNVPVCIECTSVKLPAGWQRFPDEEEMKIAIANSSSKYLNIKRGMIVDIDNTPIDWNNAKLSYETDYHIEDASIEEFEPHSELIQLKHFLDKGVCKACTIKKSGARNVTVQLRAAKRDLDASEKQKYKDLAIKTIQKSSSDVYTNYLSKVEDYHGGLDYIFGNTSVAENFLYELEKHTIGEREKNYKLVTEDKEGNRIYSITYLFRLPEVRPGDYAGYKDLLYRVENVSNRGVQLFSFRTGETQLIKDYERLILANDQVQPYKKIILSEEQNSNSYLIMDATTFENEEVLIEHFRMKLPIGEEVTFLVWNGDYYLE